jgi:two-component system, NarL family, response regulator NreC
VISSNEVPGNSVVVADDHPVVRAGLRATLDRTDDFRVVAEAADVPGAVLAVGQHRPSLLLLDLMMPGGSTISALPRVLIASPQTAVLVVTFCEDPAYARAAVAAGAVGFVLKEAAASELLRACRTVLRGNLYLDPRMGVAVDVVAHPSTCRLPGREREIVRLIALGHTNVEIGKLMHLAERTVKAGRASASRRIGATSRADLTAYAQREDLVEPIGPAQKGEAAPTVHRRVTRRPNTSARARLPT